MTVKTRVTAAVIERRNKAWLITWTGPLAPDEAKADCALGRPLAKQIALRGARELGYEGTAEWETISGYWYELRMDHVER